MNDTTQEQLARLAILREATTREPRPRSIPEHGTRSRYNPPHRCRCLPCRVAEARYQKRRTLRLAEQRKAS